MTRLDDRALERLRAAVREPDLSETKYRLAGVAGSGGWGRSTSSKTPSCDGARR